MIYVLDIGYMIYVLILPENRGSQKQGIPKLMAVNSSALEWGQEKAVTQALPGAILNCSSLFLVLKITTASISKD